MVFDKFFNYMKIPDEVICKSCRNHMDDSDGTVCHTCRYENDDAQRWINESVLLQEKKAAEFDQKIILGERELNNKIIKCDEKIQDLELEKRKFQNLCDSKIQDLIKLPEVIEKAKMKVQEEYGLEDLEDYRMKKLKELEKEKRDLDLQTEFMEIVNFIRTDFSINGKVHDEDALEGQLVQALKTQFKKKDIVVQFSTNSKVHEYTAPPFTEQTRASMKPFMVKERVTRSIKKFDILIDRKFVIELKIPDDAQTLRNLYGQLREYLDEYKYICVFILKQNEFPSHILDHYVNRYKDDLGIECIVKDGEKKKPKIEATNSTSSN